MIKQLLVILLLSLFSYGAMAQEVNESTSQEAPKELTRKERKALKRSIRAMQRKILSDPALGQRYLEIISSCDEQDEACQERLREVIDESIQGTALNDANGMTFGICKPKSTNKKLHKLVYAHREYDCKLSTKGKVYTKNLDRKIYGPGLFWDNQSIVMFCTGSAYGTKMAGWAVSVGAYIGVTATTVFGKIGACIAVGAGKSFGGFVGADAYKFEEL